MHFIAKSNLQPLHTVQILLVGMSPTVTRGKRQNGRGGLVKAKIIQLRTIHSLRKAHNARKSENSNVEFSHPIPAKS